MNYNRIKKSIPHSIRKSIPLSIKRILYFPFHVYYIRKKGIITKYYNSISYDLLAEYPVFINGPSVIGENVKIGKYTYVEEGGRIFPCVTIGRYCSIAANVIIAPTEHHYNWLTTSPVSYIPKLFRFSNKKGIKNRDERSTYIGNDVWIGINAIIKKGIVISDGAVIGSGAIVTKDVPPYAIVTGIPAEVVRYRFADDIIKNLLNLNWWEIEEILLDDIPWDNIDNAIRYLEYIKTAPNKKILNKR